MIERILPFVKEYESICEQLCDPKILGDADLCKELSKKLARLFEYVELYKEYERQRNIIETSKSFLEESNDPEIVAMTEGEMHEAESKIEEIDKQAQILLLPRDKDDDSSVFVEVRPAAGGDEASLFAAELFKMYQKYAEIQGYRTEVIDYSDTEVGGLKNGVLHIIGEGVYRNLKWESGVHRVQRVPETESQGRVHTSTVTVAIMPEVEEVDFEINPNDLRIDVYRSSGKGGQGVNTTDSAIRITHLPTNTVVTCQDERSQIKNKEKAMHILEAKLQDFFKQKAINENAQLRKSQVGTGDRSERIRTYNFPQDRVTDHRIGKNLHNINGFMLGNIEEMLQALHEEEMKLKIANSVQNN